MDYLELLQKVLSPYIYPQWHLNYGMTSSRSASLGQDKKDSNSILNPNSETALTLQILGMVDGWSQINTLAYTPRNNQNHWNSNFFTNLREGRLANYFPEQRESKAKRSSWVSILKNLSLEGPVNLEEAVLLFEFDVSAKHFHPPGKRLKNPSFLKLPNDRGWATFDAIFIVPKNRLIIFFEAKLKSDISTKTTHYSFENQIVRNLEAAYFLTSDPDSDYFGWDYRYLFIAPKKSLDWLLTQYSWIVSRIVEQIDTYHKILTELLKEQKNPVINERLTMFSDFREKSISKIQKLSWAAIVESLGPNLFIAGKYLEILKAEGVPQDAIDAIHQRFLAAGIC